MNEFVAFLGRQLAQDARTIGPRVRARLSDEHVSRYGTIEEMRAAARRGLPRVMFDFIDGGAGDEVTERRNQSDFAELEILPRMLAGVSTVDLSTTVLGEPIAVPLLASPMGLNGLVHHSGEAGIARALHAAGSVYVLGAMASYSVEEIATVAPGPTWFQMYLWRDRDLVHQLMNRAASAGMRVLVLTVDVPRPAGRDRDRRNGFGIPPRMTMRTFAEGLARPRWSAQFIRHLRMAAASVAGQGGGAQDPVSITGYINRQFDPGTTWEDIAWFRERWDGPIVIKGILTADDARRAIAAGAEGIGVSNHGGRQLDHAPSAIRALDEIAGAVGGQAELFVDGGIRRGSDIFKALATGARAVLVGRPFVYGLGAGGEAGAHRVMEILSEELRATMGLAGCRSIAEIDRSWIRHRSASPVAPAGPVAVDQTFG
jgi:L-lactate dehydrogenase (cytochrome)